MGLLRARSVIRTVGSTYLPELGRCHIGMLLERRVKCRFRVKAYLFGDSQDRVVWPGWIDQHPLGFFDPMVVYKVEKILIQLLVDYLRKMIRRHRECLRQFLKGEPAVHVWLVCVHHVEKPLKISVGSLKRES